MIKTIAIWFGALWLMLIVQVSFLPPFFGSWPVPNLIFLLVMAQAAMLPSDSGYNENRSDLVLIMALMAGLLMEIYSPRQLGLFLVSFPILAYLTRYVTDRWLDRGINIQTTSLLCLLGGIILPLIVMYSAGYFSFRYLILSLLLSTLVVIPAALIAYVRIGR